MILFNGSTRVISLDAATSVSLRAVYSRWVDWTTTSDNLKFFPAFSTVADPPKVPVYLTLENGWRILPTAGAYILSLTDGFLYTSDASDPFVPVVGVEPRIRFENPVVAVGYSSGSVSVDVAIEQLSTKLDVVKKAAEDARDIAMVNASVKLRL